MRAEKNDSFGASFGSPLGRTIDGVVRDLSKFTGPKKTCLTLPKAGEKSHWGCRWQGWQKFAHPDLMVVHLRRKNGDGR
jgi:hypothetical protein